MRVLFLLCILVFFLFGCGRDTTGMAEAPALTTAAAPATAARPITDKRADQQLAKPDLTGAEVIGRDQMAPVERMNEGTASPEDVRRYSGAKQTSGNTSARRTPINEEAAKQLALPKNAGPVVVSKIEAPTIFTIAKTPCYGECKQYSLTLHNDGTVVLDAKKNLKKKGLFTTVLSPAETNKMLDLFRVATANGLFLVYPEGEEVAADVPATKLEYPGASGIPQVVRVYADAPAGLQRLFDEAEGLAEKGEWREAIK